MRISSLIKSFPIIVLFSSSLLNAAVVPGRWEKLDSQPAGKQIIVTLKTGDRIECDFKSSGPDNLTVTDQSGSERTVPKSEVRKVTSRDKYEDSNLNGTLIGLAAGVGWAIVGIVIAEARDGIEQEEAVVAALAVSIGAGAAIGYFVDKAHKGTEVLYQAP